MTVSMGVGDASLIMKIVDTQNTELYELNQEVRRESDQRGAGAESPAGKYKTESPM